MTDAKILGLAALEHGMPWIEGLLDGSGPHLDITEDSWPDFRDPITEAWFVAWALAELSKSISMDECEHGGGWAIRRSFPLEEVWAETRAEAWILALEKLKGEG